MDDTTRGWRRVAERVDMRHHVVTEPFLKIRDRREVDVVEMRPHLGDRRRGNIDTQLLLTFRECEPQPAPKTISGLRRPERQHCGRCITLGKRRAVCLVGGHRI